MKKSVVQTLFEYAQPIRSVDTQSHIPGFEYALSEETDIFMEYLAGNFEGNGNLLFCSTPSLLAPLLRAYPGVRFDLFHMGYPSMGEIGAQRVS